MDFFRQLVTLGPPQETERMNGSSQLLLSVQHRALAHGRGPPGVKVGLPTQVT